MKEILEFDGTRVESLAVLARDTAHSPAAREALLDFLVEGAPAHQTASSWILKRQWEEGFAPPPRLARVLKGVLGSELPWQARLHLLQMMEAIPLTRATGRAVFELLGNPAEETNKLVRAWTYHALAVLADAHEELRKRAGPLLAVALEDPAGSVRARARRVLSRFGWAEPQ